MFPRLEVHPVQAARHCAALSALISAAALGAPSPISMLHHEQVGTTFEIQSIRYVADGAKLLEVRGPGLKEHLGLQHLSPGLHTLSVELVYIGHSPVFSYLSSYRFRLRTRATVSVTEGDGLELKTTVNSARSPTSAWQSSLQWRLTGTPRRAILDLENLPIEQESLDGAALQGPLAVSGEEQAHDDAEAEKTVQEVLAQAERQQAEPPPALDASADRATCEAPEVHFESAQFRLSRDAQTALWSLAGCLGNDAAARLVVEGHCDRRGSPGYNVELGRWRADSVVRYLLLRGAAAYQLQARSFGNERRVCEERTEACHARNRRVQFSKPLQALSSDTR